VYIFVSSPARSRYRCNQPARCGQQHPGFVGIRFKRRFLDPRTTTGRAIYSAARKGVDGGCSAAASCLFPIVKGIRTGVSVNPNPTARVYQVSATGRKVWNIGSTLMLVGLGIWLVAGRDEEGRLNENFLLVIIMVFVVRYLFKLSIIALFPPIETPPAK
jgi:hypothetical protein